MIFHVRTDVVFKNLFTLGKTFGRFLGPLGLVVGIVIALVDFVKGFKETEGGFFKKLMGGLGGLFAGLLGMPLDLLKNAIAWIFKMFGLIFKIYGHIFYYFYMSLQSLPLRKVT